MRHKGNSFLVFQQHKHVIFERIFPHFPRFGKSTGLIRSLDRSLHAFLLHLSLFNKTSLDANSIFKLLVTGDTGRVAVRATGSFNITTAKETVQGISFKYCQVVHHMDGYSYQKGERRRFLPIP